MRDLEKLNIQDINYGMWEKIDLEKLNIQDINYGMWEKIKKIWGRDNHR